MEFSDRYLLDIERLKVLEPIMEGLGVGRAGVLTLDERTGKHYEAHSIESFRELVHMASLVARADFVVNNSVDTYDYASLESVLPDWVFKYWNEFSPGSLQTALSLNRIKISMDLACKLVNLINKSLAQYRGQKKLEALADLIILLHENGIELKRDDG